MHIYPYDEPFIRRPRRADTLALDVVGGTGLPMLVPRVCTLPPAKNDGGSELSAAAAAALRYSGGSASCGCGCDAVGLGDVELEDLTANWRLQPEHLTTSPSLKLVATVVATTLLSGARSASDEPHCGQLSGWSGAFFTPTGTVGLDVDSSRECATDGGERVGSGFALERPFVATARGSRRLATGCARRSIGGRSVGMVVRKPKEERRRGSSSGASLDHGQRCWGGWRMQR